MTAPSRQPIRWRPAWAPLPARGGRRDAAAGFLLAETLTTFAISAFILVGLASIAPILVRAIDRGAASVQDVDALGRTLESLRRDIAGLARARWNGVEPRDFVFRGGPNSLFFAHRDGGPRGREGMSVVALREIGVGGGTRLARGEARLLATATSFDSLRFGPQRPLDTGPARLRFWYLASDKPDTPANRQASWPSGRHLPGAILIEAVDAATTRLIVTARVDIRANADIGCLLSRGASFPGQTPPADPAAAGASAPGSASAAPGTAAPFNAAAWLGGAGPGGAGPGGAGPGGAGPGGAGPRGAAENAPGIFCERDGDPRPGNNTPGAPGTAALLGMGAPR